MVRRLAENADGDAAALRAALRAAWPSAGRRSTTGATPRRSRTTRCSRTSSRTSTSRFFLVRAVALLRGLVGHRALVRAPVAAAGRRPATRSSPAGCAACSAPAPDPVRAHPHLRRLRLADVARPALVLDDLRRLLLRRLPGRRSSRSWRWSASRCSARGPARRAWSPPSTSTTSASCCSPSSSSGPTSPSRQYFLIWYGNIPEETIFFRARLAGSLAAGERSLLAVGHFVRAVLLPAAAHDQAQRRRPWSPARALAAGDAPPRPLLAGDARRSHPDGARAGPRSTSRPCSRVGGVFLAAFGWLLRRQPLVPLRDPRLPESLAFENV